MNDELILKRFDNLENKFDNLEGQVDRVAIEVVNINERLAEMATREELGVKFDRIMNAIDHLASKYGTDEQERTLMHYDLKQLEKDHSHTKADVSKIKVQLKMA
jgi:FKBP-type peptidyl-prolyl cis-trans isomerase (trigger factor)